MGVLVAYSLANVKTQPYGLHVELHARSLRPASLQSVPAPAELARPLNTVTIASVCNLGWFV